MKKSCCTKTYSGFWKSWWLWIGRKKSGNWFRWEDHHEMRKKSTSWLTVRKWKLSVWTEAERTRDTLGASLLQASALVFPLPEKPSSTDEVIFQAWVTWVTTDPAWVTLPLWSFLFDSGFGFCFHCAPSMPVLLHRMHCTALINF